MRWKADETRVLAKVFIDLAFVHCVVSFDLLQGPEQVLKSRREESVEVEGSFRYSFLMCVTCDRLLTLGPTSA